MKFSIIHPTIRTKPPYPSFPTGWRESMQSWLDRCDHPQDCEYVLSTHASCYEDLCADIQEHQGCPGWPVLGWLNGQPVPYTVPQHATPKGFPPPGKTWGKLTLVCDRGVKTTVSQGNAACEVSCGDILMGNEDDMFPPEHWDTLIWDMIPHYDISGREYVLEVVLHCSSGSPIDDTFFIPQILTKARYKRLGYRAHPSYESMYWDQEFAEHAKLDGVAIEARHIVFEHRHFSLDKSQMDSVYRHENRRRAYDNGLANLKHRRALGFPRESEPMKAPGYGAEPVATAIGKRMLAVCTPGETFSAIWVWHFYELICGAIQAKIALAPFQGYCTYLFMTRENITRDVLACPVKPDYVLWIDDDNLLEWPQVMRLINDLDAHPEAGMVTGWYWIQAAANEGGARSSVGRWINDRFVSVPADELDRDELLEVDAAGFGCLMMRREVLEKVGVEGFTPHPDDHVRFGVEDVAFCLNAKRKGYRLFADGRVHVPHLKLRPIEPTRLEVMPEKRPDDRDLAKEIHETLGLLSDLYEPGTTLKEYMDDLRGPQRASAEGQSV